MRGWTVPAYAKTLIRRSALLRGRPVADVRALIEELYQTTFPMDFASVLASPVEYHPLATDAATGESTDLRPFVASPAELRLALRTTFLGRDARLAAADRQLADYEHVFAASDVAPAASDLAPAVFSIRPAAASPQVSPPGHRRQAAASRLRCRRSRHPRRLPHLRPEPRKHHPPHSP